jgi:predicted nucleic acid-binding protein
MESGLLPPGENKHHAYVADALQVVSCQTEGGAGFVTADRRLAGIARDEGLKVTLVG